MKRKVHELIEGFPEQGIFTRHQDVGYLHSFSASRIPYGRVKRATVAYRRYPGNSLDKQMKKFQTDPAIENIKSEEELGEDYIVRRMLMKRHCAHVLKKATEIARGNPPPPTFYYHKSNNNTARKFWRRGSLVGYLSTAIEFTTTTFLGES